jgi:O-antigen ligase
MTTTTSYAQPVGVIYSPSHTVPAAVEYGYYLYVVNAVFGSLWGISLPLLGGGTIAALCFFCIWRLKSDLTQLLAPLKLLLACLISFLIIQIVVYGESITDSTGRGFTVTILHLILIRCLLLRPGFGHRLALVLFFVGLAVLPFIGFKAGLERAYVEEEVAGNFTNANGLAEWFGFCALYFGVLGFENKRSVIRILAWSAVLLCLFIVGLTVSRGALAATAIGLIFASRRILKRGFLPLVFLVILAWVITETGLFSNIYSLYLERAGEDTGRIGIWSEALKMFFSSPLAGLGAANSGVYLPGELKPLTTHNTFLFFAVASGIIPLLFFALFWIVALKRSLTGIDQQDYGAFRAPLLMYFLVISFIGDLSFTFPAGLLGVVIGAGAGAGDKLPRFLVFRTAKEGLYKLARLGPAGAKSLSRRS